MNRSQRRKMEKDLGIMKTRQGMNFKERMQNLQSNIHTGKDRNKEMEEKIKRQKNEANDQKAKQELSSLATTLMIKDKLSWSKAIEAAKIEIAKANYEKEEIS